MEFPNANNTPAAQSQPDSDGPSPPSTDAFAHMGSGSSPPSAAGFRSPDEIARRAQAQSQRQQQLLTNLAVQVGAVITATVAIYFLVREIRSSMEVAA